ncbi:conserved hypothetical protein, secreted [Beggiatoa sp. PS]|nr:conserved hypothetical protein, secreted [Beggiatoa sp. PS]
MRYKSLTCAIAMSVGMLTAPLTLADLNDGLIAYYPFDGNAQDTSGNGNHGTVNGATLTENRFGKADSAYHFDGQDDYIDLGNVNTNISSQFSISAEIKAPQDRSAYRVVLSKGLKSRSHFEVYIEKDRTSPYTPGEFRFYSPNLPGTGASGSLPGDFGSGKVVDDDTFHHLVVTYDGSTTTFYLDGLMVYKEPTTGVYVDETAQFFIGRQTHTEHGNMPFKGVIDEVRIYNRVLSKNEVKQLYRRQKVKPPCHYSCFWMENVSGKFKWVPRDKFTKQQCFELDSCSGGLKKSSGGCYKWATSSDMPGIQW